MSAPQRPSDAIEAALVKGSHDDRWRGDGRLDSVGVKTLVALREMGWDVVRKVPVAGGDARG